MNCARVAWIRWKRISIPADRYLMERFVAGAARLHGEPRRRGQYLLLENPAVKASQYRPSLKVVSFDIETAMEGLQLYSIAVHGKSAAGEVRRVFMLGAGAQQEFVVSLRHPGGRVAGLSRLDCGLRSRRADRLERGEL